MNTDMWMEILKVLAINLLLYFIVFLCWFFSRSIEPVVIYEAETILTYALFDIKNITEVTDDVVHYVIFIEVNGLPARYTREAENAYTKKSRKRNDEDTSYYYTEFHKALVRIDYTIETGYEIPNTSVYYAEINREKNQSNFYFTDYELSEQNKKDILELAEMELMKYRSTESSLYKDEL